MIKFLQSLSQKHERPFWWRYFATSHGKTVAEATGSKAKALLCAKVKSKRAKIIIIQASDDFSKTAEQSLDKAEVIHISQEEISSWISEVIDWSLIKLEYWLCVRTMFTLLYAAIRIQFRHWSVLVVKI